MTVKKSAIRRTYWDQAFLAVFFIYLTIPLALPLTNFLKRFLSLNLVINTVIIVLLLSLAVLLIRNIPIKRASTYFFMAVLSAGYLAVIILPKIPVEKVHCMEYGFLSYLIFRALRLDLKSYQAYALALIMTGMFGWLDEGIQYLMPGRYYALSDVWLNVYGGWLGLLATHLVRRELPGES